MKQSVLSKFRRLLALSLALLLIVSLTGCFKKDNPETPDGTNDQSQTDPTKDAVSTEEPTETPTEAPTEPPVQTIMGTISANNLNVRSNPSTGGGSTVLSQLPVNLRVEILEQTTETTEKGDVIEWGRIGEMELPNGTKIIGGWIQLRYVQLDGQTAEEPTEPSGGNVSTGAGKKGTITATELNIRKEASGDSERVGAYVKGDEVEILEQKTVDGTTWGRTNKGWISLKYVKMAGSEDNTGNTNTNTGKDDDDKTTSSEVVSNGKTSVLGYAVIDYGSLNVRTGPGTNYDKVDSVSRGQRFGYYQTSGNWIRIKDGWISKSYVYIEGTTADDGGTGTVTATELNLRNGPDSSYKSKGVLKKGDSITILAQVNGWGYTSKGWVSMKYIELAAPTYPTGEGTVTTDLNIRKEANKDSEDIGDYKKGDKVTITEVKDGWGKTNKGWVSMKYVSMGTGGNTTFKVGKATVNVNSTLNIRKEAKADSDSLGYYVNGDVVNILEVANTHWGKVEYKTGEYGWISLQYVKY